MESFVTEAWSGVDRDAEGTETDGETCPERATEKVYHRGPTCRHPSASQSGGRSRAPRPPPKLVHGPFRVEGHRTDATIEVMKSSAARLPSRSRNRNRARPPDRPLVLGIETSCDDTACALVDGTGRVLSSVVSSQLAAHRPFGGVVPEIASREHLANWPPVSAAALEEAGLDPGALDVLDVVAATRGPGLVGSLLVGLSLGKAIAYALKLPFHAVHHLEGHLYSPFLHPPSEPGADGREQRAPSADPVPDRFTGLVVSGGHTALYAVDGRSVETLAETRDDAMGESFDKVGKRLGLAYPQGPTVDSLAERGDPARRPFAVPKVRGERRADRMDDGRQSLDFSYSGLKSQTLLEIERLERRGLDTRPDKSADPPFGQEVLDLLAGFRTAAVGQILDRVERLRRDRGVETLAVSGGAAANRLLRRELEAWAAEHGVVLRLVPLTYAGDNAAMIAHAALLQERRGERDDVFTAEAASRIGI